MEKNTIYTGGVAEKNAFMCANKGLFDKKRPYTGIGMYPDDEDIISALCLVDLMINRNRLILHE